MAKYNPYTVESADLVTAVTVEMPSPLANFTVGIDVLDESGEVVDATGTFGIEIQTTVRLDFEDLKDADGVVIYNAATPETLTVEATPTIAVRVTPDTLAGTGADRYVVSVDQFAS